MKIVKVVDNIEEVTLIVRTESISTLREAIETFNEIFNRNEVDCSIQEYLDENGFDVIEEDDVIYV